jgi:hypothetical protein
MGHQKLPDEGSTRRKLLGSTRAREGQSYTPTRSVPMRVAAHPWSGIGPGPFNFFAFVSLFFFPFFFFRFLFYFLFLSVYFFFCSN